MVFISPTINALSISVRVIGKKLVRDFSEIESLQSSKRGTKVFSRNSLEKLKTNLLSSLKKIKPNFKINEINDTFNEPEESWVIIPIDGMDNFEHAIPHFSIGVGIKQNNDITSCVIYDPIKDEMFFSSRGKGSFLNDFRIRVSDRKVNDNLLLSTDQLKADNELFLKNFSKVRILGSILLDYCYLASGKIDTILQCNVNPNYFKFGELLISESGGVLKSVASKNYFIASNKNIEKKISEFF